ncbi:MAG: VWA domain-containing protein [Rhodospirillales bacterium 20-64-7]|nr:MAG: VWA domain-containing protein [Rhodospirillales bacterium 20-64-7]
MLFARLLRRSGLALGPAETIAAAQALECVGVTDRGTVKLALRTVMVHRHEDAELFDLAFELFWTSHAAAAIGAGPQDPVPPSAPASGARRLAEALAGLREPGSNAPAAQHDATATYNALERLQRMDFATMGVEDIARAKAEIRTLKLPLDARRTRRWRPLASGDRADLAATIRASRRTAGEITTIVQRRRIRRPPPLVVLCDISGSMARYAPIMLHFLHSVANDRARVSIFLFGTRLTNITRQLKGRDPEVAYGLVSRLVPDWSGGTRIGETVQQFNQLWGRRILGQGAVVLLITDGLDRDGAAGVADGMARLHRSCRRLIWLNPLLRWDGFSPQTEGARAMLPHVDEFRPVHNLNSLNTLIASLSAPPPPRRSAILSWKVS